MASPVSALRSLRHGALKPLDPLWLVLGRLYRSALRMAPRSAPTSQWIGRYGPFKMNPFFAFSDFAHWGGGHNSCFAACVESCRGATCVIDVGAHIGLLALPISRLLAPGGRLVAFEPAAANYNHLVEHLGLNACDNVEAIDALVGAEDRQDVTFYELDEPTGINSVVGGGRCEGLAETRRRQVSLDSFCRARQLRSEIIKIDVEGAELDVLKGARDTIASCRPKIFLSVHPARIADLGRSIEQLAELVDALGYRFYDSDGNAVEGLRFGEH